MSEEIQKTEKTIYHEFYVYDHPVKTIRLTVVHQNDAPVYHPLNMIAAAKEFIKRMEELYSHTSESWGPHEVLEPFTEKSV